MSSAAKRRLVVSGALLLAGLRAPVDVGQSATGVTLTGVTLTMPVVGADSADRVVVLTTRR